MSMNGTTSLDVRSDHTISRFSVQYAKVLRTNTFTDNECILSVVVQVIASLRWLDNLVLHASLSQLDPCQLSEKVEGVVGWWLIRFHNCFELGF